MGSGVGATGSTGGGTGAGGASSGATGTGASAATGPISGAGAAASGSGTGGSPTGGSGGAGTGGNGDGGTAAGGAGTGGGGGTTSPDVTVELAQLQQEMAGFGINNNWAPAMSDADADTMFGTAEGQLGMNILRVGMGEDGEPFNGQNCWSDIDKATARGAQHIIATLWSPPANCKTNNSVDDGGHLLQSCYESWSDTIAAFPAKVAANTNATLYAMSPQNEVDFASCGREEPCNGNYPTTVMTGAEAAAFTKIVGPKLRAAGVQVMSVEASEWIHVWSNESAAGSEPSGFPSSDPLDCGFPPDNCPAGAPFDDGYEYGYALWDDPQAWAAFDIMGTHQYDTQVAERWPSDVTERKPVWQTEMSGVKWWPEQGDIVQDASAFGGWAVSCSTHIENGVAVARWIHSGITLGEASAWLYWWYRAIDTDDNEGLICKDGRVAKRHWTFGQYSRFIRPGYTMVAVTGDVPANVLLSAALGPDGTVVVVAVNENTAAVDVPITIAGGTAPASMSVWQTSASDDMAPKDAVTVTGGLFTASLPAMSVTTFAGQ
jgi:glucuronoarabinoxylan endo-1,4-beta-xylanase